MSMYQPVRNLTSLSEFERIAAAGARFVIDELSKADVIPARQRWLRPAAAAFYLGIDTVTLAQWRGKTNAGPSYRKIGDRVVYDVADLDKWVASHKRIEGGGL